MSERGLHVLHVGALDSIHVRRWAEMSAELGHRVSVAGHLRPGFSAAVADCHRAPQLSWSNSRRAQQSGRRLDGALAALPNPIVEVPLAAAWLRRLVRRLRPDVVHTHWLPHWGAAAAVAGVRPLAVHAMGSDVYLLGGLRRRLAGLAVSRADAALAYSPHAARALGGRHLEQGIDLDAFRPPRDGEREVARARLGLGREPTVLSFRGPSAVYDVPLVVDGFRALLRSRPDARLVVLHGPQLDSRTREAVASLGGAARVLGRLSADEMRACFHAADVGISVPRSDGSPVSVWEALACGMPVVCSPLAQVVDRAAGGLVPAGRSAAEVARTLDDVLAGDPRALGAAGRAWCEANMDRRHALRRLDALYRELTGTASGGARSPQAVPT